MRHSLRVLGSELITMAGLLAVAGAASAQSGQSAADRHNWSLRFDVDSPAVATDYGTWLGGGVGKLRYGEDSSNLGVGRAVFTYDYHIRPTLAAHLVADYARDGSPGVDATEAYLEWRPVPRSSGRHRLRAGMFYPPISLENGDAGWSSPYSITSSAINTWIAEEIRTIGFEWSFGRPLGARAAGREMRWFAGVYWNNDPAGTLLSWKGWSLHDRQSRFGDVLMLPALPQIGPGAMFQNQAFWTIPFQETDGRAGIYAGTEWRVSRRARLTAMHYDNRADPLSLRDGQYGWSTDFNHAGAQIDLPLGLGLVAQWMEGVTGMGPTINGTMVIDNDFASYFLLLTRRFDKHRVSLRYDDFEVVDRDSTPLDANDEHGDALTLAYRFDQSERLSFELEWLRITTARSSFAYFGLPTHADERVLQARMTFRLAPAP